MAIIVGMGAYFLADLTLYANGLQGAINGPLGFPVFLDFGFLASPIAAWLESLGPEGGVPVEEAGEP